MPFRLGNAPSVYQLAMHQVLGDFIGKFILVFSNNIVIYRKSEVEHREHVSQVLDTFELAIRTLKDLKCSWAQSQVNLLRYGVC